MKRLALIALIVVCPAIALRPEAGVAGNPKDSLQGVWVGQSMQADGKALPAEVAKRMQFTFKGDKLFIKGNFDGEREEECPCKIDAKQSPKHLEFSPPKEKNPILGIYEVKGDELKVCLRHGSSEAGRPTDFATKTDSKLVLIVFRKKKQ